MAGSCRPPCTVFRILLLQVILTFVHCSVPDWYLSKHSIAAMSKEAQTQSSTCKKIGVYCGASKCCKGLVCEPVVSKLTGRIAPRCAVPDPSTMDSKACYAHSHVCYFHSQCCSGHCEDHDADHIFECTPSNITGWIPDTELEDENVHFGDVNSTVPVLAIVLSVIGLVGISIAVATRVYRKSRGHDKYQSLGVDEIPSSGWANNNSGGKYAIGWHDDLIHEYRSNDDNNSDLKYSSGPPLPPRDYEVDMHTTSPNDSSEFTEIAHSTPVRPVVDYN